MSDIPLTERDLQHLLDMLHSVTTKWFMLGLYLRLPNYKLESIKAQYYSSMEDKLMEVFDAWLNTDISPTVEKLVRALKSIDRNDLAMYVLDEYSQPTQVADEIAQFIDKKKEITRSTAHVMVIGFPGHGKSHLLDNLLKNPKKKAYTSTDISTSVITVDVEAEDLTSHTAALGVEWKKFEIDESFMMQAQNCRISAGKDGAIIKNNDPQLKASSDETSETTLTQNIKSVLKKNRLKKFAQLKGTSSLYFRDTGGQVEFQEILTILIDGPCIFFFVMMSHIPLDEPLTVEYRRGNEVINRYESCTTTRQALIQTLASIDAIIKPEGVTTHDPTVLVIGTHADELGINPKEKKNNLLTLNEKLDKIIKEHGFDHLVEYNDRKADEVIFPVENTSKVDTNFQFIRKRVNSKLQNDAFEIGYPASYLLFYLELRNFKEDIVDRQMCTEIAAKFKIEGEEEITKMLLFLHHRIGIIRYYDVDGLRHLVIKEPQVLFKKLTDLILKTFSSCTDMLSYEIKDLDRGIIDPSALKLKKDCQMTTEQFLLLLVHLRIITSFEDNEENGKKKYFMPAVLNHLPESKNSNEDLKVSPYMISFSCEYSPKGLFGTVVCQFMNHETIKKNGKTWKFSLKKDDIFKDQVSWTVHAKTVCTPFEIQGEVSLKMHSTHAEVTFRPDEDEDFKTLTATCQTIREIFKNTIDQSLEHLRYDQKKIKQVLCFKCDENNCSELHPVEFKKKKVTIQCNKRRIYLKERQSCWFDTETTLEKIGSFVWQRLNILSCLCLFILMLAILKSPVSNRGGHFYSDHKFIKFELSGITTFDQLLGVDFNRIRKKNIDGYGTRIAIIDSCDYRYPQKIYMDHKALHEKIEYVPICKDGGRDFKEDHALVCTSIAVGRAIQDAFYNDPNGNETKVHYCGGIAPEANATVYLVEVNNRNSIVAALDKVLDGNFDVLSMSFACEDYDDEVAERLEKIKKNTIVVAAAGNIGNYGPVGFPANHPDVICVGSLTVYFKVAGYSPDEVDTFYVGKLLTPSSRNSTSLKVSEGTSMATPGIAGIVCLLVQIAKKHDCVAEIKKRTNVLKLLNQAVIPGKVNAKNRLIDFLDEAYFNKTYFERQMGLQCTTS